MDRLQPDLAPCEPTPNRASALDRAHWERIAEESLARVFQTTGSGLISPTRTATAGGGEAARNTHDGGPSRREATVCRQGFRLAMTGSGTSFTSIIGACFHFQSLRQLTAASGRHLGLKAVIVLSGQVVLLPDTSASNGPVGRAWLPAPATTTRNRHWKAIAMPKPAAPPERTLLGLAQLMPLPLERSDTLAMTIAPARLPLWRG